MQQPDPFVAAAVMKLLGRAPPRPVVSVPASNRSNVTTRADRRRTDNEVRKFRKRYG